MAPPLLDGVDMYRSLALLLLVSGCWTTSGYGQGADGVEFAQAITGIVEVAAIAAAVSHDHPPEPPPPPPYLRGPITGTVLWQGTPGDGIGGVTLVMTGASGSSMTTATARGGHFELPYPIPYNEYRITIHDSAIRGFLELSVGPSGPPKDLVIIARERRPGR
jgi:hypothetical protein